MTNRTTERGAIVVEATLSLTAFVFVLFTVLSIVNICYIQAKMGVALNSAAKEISQYSYLYYKLGAAGLESKLTGGVDDYNAAAKNTIDGVGSLMGALSGSEEAIQTGDFESLVEEAEKGTKTVKSLVKEYSDLIGDDPKGFIIGMGKLAAGEAIGKAKEALAQVLATIFMKKNLKANAADDPDAFLKRYRVVNGLDGLDFTYTSLMAYGTSDEIMLVVTYDVRVLQLLQIDFDFTFRQVAQTRAWGLGVSKIPEQEAEMPEEGSIWDMTDQTQRGKIIVSQVKKKYPYTASQKFDAYDNTGGKNQFTTIVTVDTRETSYQNADGIVSRLNRAYSNMEAAVRPLKDPITVSQNGTPATVASPKESRTYQLELVIPANADMAVVHAAIREFEQGWPGEPVSVVINQSFGSPTKANDG